MNITIYPAQKADAGVILDMIIELAEYELSRNQVIATREDIEKRCLALIRAQKP